MPNNHRVNMSFGNKVNLFTSVKYSVSGNTLNIAGIKIILADKIKQTGDGETVFMITTDDAARLMNKLARLIHNTHFNMVESRLMTKWETWVAFVAVDFE
jgi:hypothetical protein